MVEKKLEKPLCVFASHLLTTPSHLWNKINDIIIIFNITTTIIIIITIIIRVVFNLPLKNQYQSNYSNHNNRKQHGEPVRIPSNYLYLRAQVKLRVQSAIIGSKTGARLLSQSLSVPITKVSAFLLSTLI